MTDKPKDHRALVRSLAHSMLDDKKTVHFLAIFIKDDGEAEALADMNLQSAVTMQRIIGNVFTRQFGASFMDALLHDIAERPTIDAEKAPDPSSLN